MEHNIFLQISILLGVTVSLSFVARLLRQPLLVAYMITGIICGPLFFNLISGESQIYHALSNFGVALLLFIVGLELNFSYLKKIGRTSFLIGLFQFIFNFSAIFLVANYFFDLSLSGLIFLSLAACFSSTIVILKLLSDKRDEDSVYGRYTIGVLLIQDLISIIILFTLSVLYPNETINFSYLSLFRVLGVFLLIGVVAKFILNKVIDKIAASAEFLFIFTVTWCFTVASLMVWGGLSMELGAVVAGLALGSSKYQPEIVSRIKPLRDFFIVIFFIVLGSLADFSKPEAVFGPAIILSATIVIIKPLMLYFIFRGQEFTRRNSFLSALAAIPLSEFGFIILLAALNAGALSGSELSIFTLATIITIIISSYLINYNAQIYNFLLPFFLLFGKDKYIQKEDVKESFEAMVFGYHRTGWKIGNALKEIGLKFAAVDFNPENVTKLSSHKIKTFFGDISDIEFLKALPLERVKIIISTVHSPEDQLVMLDYLKKIQKKPIIICTLYNKKYLDRLYEAGADYVMLPHLLSGTWISGLIVNGDLVHKRTLNNLRKIQTKELKGSLDHKKIEKIIKFS